MTDIQTSLPERTAVVTGAAGGMGQATCRRLARDGWSVLALDRNPAGLQALTTEHASIVAMECDLGDPQLGFALQERLQGMSGLRGLVSMAGASVGDVIERLQDADWEASFAINVTPAMRLTRALAPLMRAAGGGSIVNVGSPVGIVGARKPSYSASKAALQGLTVSCARNLGGDGIRVNLLLPGPTITGMTRDWSEERRAAIAAESFLGRLCQPDEVAASVAFLLGPDSSYLTGSVLDLTAGTMWGH